MKATEFTFSTVAEDFLAIADEMNEFQDILDAEMIEREAQEYHAFNDFVMARYEAQRNYADSLPTGRMICRNTLLN